MQFEVPVDQGFYQSTSLPFGAQECSGLIPVMSEGDGTSSRSMLMNIPGKTLFKGISGVDSFWGAHVFNGELYVLARDVLLSGNSLYHVSSSGGVTDLGVVNTGIGSNIERAIMADNGETLCIVVPGVASYFYDAVNGLAQITDSTFQTWEADAGGVTSVVEIDGYFVFSTNVRIFHSSSVVVNMGQDFDALAYQEPFLKESLVRVGEARGELFALGETQTKVYRNVATEPFAFAENPSATIKKGLTFRDGWIPFDNSFFFWGAGENETPAIWRGTGAGTVTKVSTDAIDAVLGGYSTAGTARNPPSGYSMAFGYSWDGQLIVGFYNNTKSYLYNITASARKGAHVWFTDGEKEIAPIKVYDKLLDFTVTAGTGNLGYFDTTHNKTVGGDANTCVFAGPYLKGQGNALFVSEIELLAETGTASSAWDAPSSDSNPQVLLEYSKDEGRTWTSKGYRSMGRSGEYRTNVRWHRLGRFDDTTIFRFTIETGARVSFRGVRVTAEEGN